MRLFAGVAFSLLVGGALAAPLLTPPPPTGVYRSAAQYRRSQPAPAGAEVRASDKRQGLIVMQRQGSQAFGKTVVPYDSVWGYVNEKGVGYRLFQGEEYRIEAADTLTIYSNNAPNRNAGSGGPAMRTYTATGYYFSRGLSGLIFPLTEKNLRLAYEAGNPAFVAAVKDLGTLQALSDFDKKTGTYRVVRLYRDTMGK
ncbi:hypothetical protein Q5H93_13935 [Hymenobacter sp. ASUV-10]|uniref:WG repeat-containing protein n=1 Tax=Hymenobacter aranciens TaxID=3063996 RepID=A0ABT9BC64_9BACT|nr:hypothetical protein [Hymenobacter sp. ASUV-10]MDO7875838.1 hypothetical protein [Hymenobacter sp. ASUV-10]